MPGPEDRQAIREASGKYRGTISGSLLIGESVSSFNEDLSITTRLPRKKGRFTNRFLLAEEVEGFEGDLGSVIDLQARIRKIKVRGKKVRYRGVVKIPEPLGLESAPMVGLLNALSKKTKTGHRLTYPIALSRLLDADNFEFLDDDLQLALFVNFLGTK